MDNCETWAYEYLRYLGISADEIVFEPNGKSTFPDFEVKETIGVEVRRLNQHIKNAAGEWEALEELARPLHKRLVTLLDEFGPPMYGASWYVIYEFKRPQKTKKWEPVLQGKLQMFLQAQPDSRASIVVDEHFSLRLFRRAEPGARTFILGGMSDLDAGGWLDTELQTNIPISVDEKTLKREPHRGQYDRWWLILIDHMMAGEQGKVEFEHNWDKVVVIFPDDYQRAYEIPSTGKSGGQ